MTTERSILVIDDDPDVRESIADALDGEGYRVVGASDGADALRLLVNERCRPEMILLDMMMPGMDGWAFRAEQLRHPELASIPVIVFTAYGVPADTVRQLGAADVLNKPLRLDELLSVLGRVRERHGAP